MALKAIFDDMSYSFSGNMATISVKWHLIDDALLDAEGNPKVLWSGTVTVRQNLDVDAPLDELNARLDAAIENSVSSAVQNALKVQTLFTTYNPDDIATSILTRCQTTAETVIANLTGG